MLMTQDQIETILSVGPQRHAAVIHQRRLGDRSVAGTGGQLERHRRRGPGAGLDLRDRLLVVDGLIVAS